MLIRSERWKDVANDTTMGWLRKSKMIRFQLYPVCCRNEDWSHWLQIGNVLEVRFLGGGEGDENQPSHAPNNDLNVSTQTSFYTHCLRWVDKCQMSFSKRKRARFDTDKTLAIKPRLSKDDFGLLDTGTTFNLTKSSIPHSWPANAHRTELWAGNAAYKRKRLIHGSGAAVFWHNLKHASAKIPNR